MQPSSQTYSSENDPNWDPVLRDQKVFPDVPNRLLSQRFFSCIQPSEIPIETPHEFPAEILIKPPAEIPFEIAPEILVEVAVSRSDTKLPC